MWETGWVSHLLEITCYFWSISGNCFHNWLKKKVTTMYFALSTISKILFHGIDKKHQWYFFYWLPPIETFLDMINRLNLEQLIDFPMRNGSFLDLLLTNNPSLVTSIKDLPGISDHTSIASIDICHPRRLKQISRTIGQISY